MITTVLTCILPRKSFLNFFQETWSCPTYHFLVYVFLHFSLTSRVRWLPQTSDILVMVMCGYIARYANPSCNQKRDFCSNFSPRFQHFHFSVRNWGTFPLPFTERSLHLTVGKCIQRKKRQLVFPSTPSTPWLHSPLAMQVISEGIVVRRLQSHLKRQLVLMSLTKIALWVVLSSNYW